MKRILSLLLVCSIVCSISFVGTLPAFAMEGTGIASDPYIITEASQLSQIESGGYYKLGADLTVTTPIAGKGGFTLDGNNYTITLDIAGKGLFETVNGTTAIKNLILDGKVVGSASTGTGALIGHTEKSATVTMENIINFALVSSPNYTASLVGHSADATINIIKCENYGTIGGTLTSGTKNNVAGFVGRAYIGSINITSSYNYGTVDGGASNVYAAGFIVVYGGASSSLSMSIENSGNYGDILGDYMAGLVTFTDATGNLTTLDIKNSFNAGKVQNYKDVGTRQASFAWKSTVTGNVPKVTIDNCFNIGNIGHTQSGAFATSGTFTNFGTVKNSYNAGKLRNFGAGSTTENCYYLEGTVTQNPHTAVLITDDALKGGLPSGFDSFEYVTNSEATENYAYPQIKSNRIYFGYKTISKDTNTYNLPSYSLIKGTVKGAQANPFTYSEKLNDGTPVSAFGTYKGLGQTDIIYGNTFSIDKSAVIYIVSKDSSINSQGFTPVLSTDGTTNAYVYDKYGVKYYLSSKTVLVENGTTDITTPSGTLNVFVGWLDNVKLSVAPSLNGEIYLDDVKITDETEKTYLKGQEIKLTVIPTTGYYLKALNVNSTIHSENIIEETNIFLALDSDISVTAEFKEYKPELKFEVLRETNSQGTIDQKVKLSGNAYDFMSGKVISLEIKNSQNQVVLSENKAVGGDGSFEIVKLFTNPSDNYIINAKINNLTFVIEDDSNNGTYYIPTIAAINNLLTSLNGDTALINKTQLALDIETDRDLNFDVNIYKKLSTLKTDIVTRFLSYNDGAYSVDNISERFATSVILSVMNNGTADEIKAVSEYYENDYLKLKDETVYFADFGTLNASNVYALMSNCEYNSISDVKLNFKNSIVIGLIKNTFNSGNILPILIKYKQDLNIPEITTINNYTDYRQRKAMEYLSSNKGLINTYEDLKDKLEYITKNINQIAPTIIPPSGGGGGGGSSITVSGGGGGGTQPSAIGKAEDVTSKYGDIVNEETISKPTGELVYFNDFSSETVGETPVSVSISGSSGSAIVVSDETRGNCVKLIDTDEGYGGVDLARTFSAVDEPIAYEVEFKWLSGTGNVGMYVLMGNSGANAFQLVTNTANSNLSYENKNGNQNFPGSGIPLKKGEWYKVRVVLDVKNQTANFTVKSDAYKGINTNALIKSVTYDEKTNTIATGMIPLKGDFTSSISRVTFRTGRWQSEFLVSYIKVETKPVDLIGKNEIKAPDAPTVPAPQPHPVEDEINIKLNGEYVYSYIKPIMKNDRVLVSVRNILEMFNMDVQWDEATQTVTAKDEKNTVVLKNNDTNILVNGEVKETDVPAQIYNDRIYVPLRFLSECFGMTVDWEQETQTVIIGG